MAFQRSKEEMDQYYAEFGGGKNGVRSDEEMAQYHAEFGGGGATRSPEEMEEYYAEFGRPRRAASSGVSSDWIPKMTQAEREDPKFMGGWGPTALGVGAGIGTAMLTSGLSIPLMIAAEGAAGVGVGSLVRGLENLSDDKDFLEDQSLGTATLDGGLAALVPGVAGLGSKVLGSGIRAGSGALRGAMHGAPKVPIAKTVADLPDDVPFEQAMPSDAIMQANLSDRGTARQAFESRASQLRGLKQSRTGTSGKQRAILDRQISELERTVPVSERLRMAQEDFTASGSNDDLLALREVTEESENLVRVGQDYNTNTRGSFFKNLRETAEALLTSPARGSRARGRRAGNEFEEAIGRAHEVEGRIGRAVNERFLKLKDDLRYLPENSVVRTDLTGVLEGRVAFQGLSDVEQEMATRIMAARDWVSEKHVVMNAMTGLKEDGVFVLKDYVPIKDYAPMLRKSVPGGKNGFRGMSSLKHKQTTNFQRGLGRLPDSERVIDADGILDYFAMNDSKRVAHEMAWGGEQVIVNIDGATTTMPRHMADMMEEMRMSGRNVTAENMRLFLKNEMGENANMSMAHKKLIQKIKGGTTRALLPKNWTAQLAEAKRARGWSDWGAHKEGKAFAEAHPEMIARIRERASAMEASVNDILDPNAEEFLVPYVNGRADAYARGAGMNDYIGMAHVYAREGLEIVNSGKKLTMLQRQRMSEILPELQPEQAAEFLAEQAKHGYSEKALTDVMDQQARRLFHTYTGAGVPPGLRHPIGSLVGQFRVFGLNVGGQFKEDVLSPIYRGSMAYRRGLKAGDAELAAEGMELALHGYKRMARTTAYMAVPGLLHRGLRTYAYTNGARVQSNADLGEKTVLDTTLRDIPGGIAGIWGEIGGAILSAMVMGDRRGIENTMGSLPVAGAVAGATTSAAGTLSNLLQGDVGAAATSAAPGMNMLGGLLAQRGGAKGPMGLAYAPRHDSRLVQDTGSLVKSLLGQ
jgi:hypothetical protein